MLTLDDTIAAVASAPGGAARGIVRLSGPQVVEIISRSFQPTECAGDWSAAQHPTVFSGRITCATAVGTVSESAPLQFDAEIFLWPTARSYTRQPLAEIHTVGSPPLLQAALQTVCSDGARLAQPGEFTLRAFLAGRIDLTQAEAVLGVIDAADRRQFHTALAQLAGGLSRPLQQLRDDLLNLLADLEAGLDFVEDDIRFISANELENRLAHAAAQLEQISQQLAARDTSGNQPRVVFIGWPNVGKSSLFNALIGKSAALVSPQAGTTRDYLTATVDAAGLQIELVDTAGLETPDANQSQSLASAAQDAATGQHQQADLRLLCLDATRPLNTWERDQLTHANANDTLIVLTKCDQHAAPWPDIPAIQASSRTGTGLDELRMAIRERLTNQPSDTLVVASTAARARASILTAGECLSRARSLVKPDALHQSAEELVASEIRAALAELGRVVGAVYTDDLLDRIFSRFCIGK